MIEQLIYSSNAVAPTSQETLDSILEAARTNNQDLGVTGFLIFDGENFLQLLEGEPEILESLFTKIAKDSRHKDVQPMIRQRAENHCFSNWSMAYVTIESGELKRFGGSMSRENLSSLISCLRGSKSPVRQVIVHFLQSLSP